MNQNLLIKGIYFPDSIVNKRRNNYAYETNGDNDGAVTFYLTFTHKADTNDSMIITLHWRGGNYPINIFIRKDRVVVTRNALINEPSLKIIDIPNNAKGKQFYFWLFVKDDTMKFIFSGSSQQITVTYSHFRKANNEFWLIYVSDSSFTIKRGLITKNNYDTDSDAYEDIKEYGRSQGTII